MRDHKISDIELLRAVAIAFTLTHHAHALLIAPDWIYAGVTRYATYWAGVDLFLAVSGFVIARSFILHLEASKGHEFAACGAFWVRRVFRILPLAWAGLVLTVGVVMLLGPAVGDLKATLWDSAAAVLQFANVRHWYILNGWATGGANGVYWSLSLEEQFYLVMPFLVLLAGRRLGVVVAALAAVQIFIPRPPGSLLFDFRTDAILLGIAAFLFSRTEAYGKLRERLAGLSWARGAFAALAVLGLALLPAPSSGFPLHTGAVAVISAALVLLASYDFGILPKQTALHTLAMWVGSRSFAIYIVHMPIFRVTKFSFNAMGWAADAHLPERAVAFAAGLAVTALVAEASFQWIETPFRGFGRRIADRMAPLAPPMTDGASALPTAPNLRTISRGRAAA